MERIITERAHLMCPGMTFGIVAAVEAPFDEARISDAAEKMALAHPFLRALLGYRAAEDAYFYDVTDSSKIALAFGDQQIHSIDSACVLAEFDRLAGREWNLFSEGMLKLTAWKMGGKTCFLLAFHHLLADGRGALGLALELAEYLARGTEPAFAPEKLILPAQDLPSNSSLPFVSRALVGKANRDWKKEKRRVSYEEYLAFADGFLRRERVRRSVRRVPAEELGGVLEKCRAHGVSVNDYLMAKTYAQENTDKLIIACDLRDRLPRYAQGSLGNYATAFSVVYKRRGEDLFTAAEHIRELVRGKMASPRELYLVLQCYAALEPGLLDAACISCRGDFPSKAARFIGSAFFGFGEPKGCSVTNLGRTESAAISRAYFIPPASPAMRKTLGVLTANGEMIECASER